MDDKNPNEEPIVEIPAAEEPSQDPVQQERERIEKKDKLTPLQRLNFAKTRIEAQIAEITGTPEPDKETPVTVGMLEQMKKDESKQTALQLADAIPDENERIVVKDYLENRIVPSGNPQSDLSIARAAVNALKNAQIAEELARGGAPRTHNSGNGAPPRAPEGVFEPTPEERVFMGPPYNLTKEEVIAKRPK